MAEATEAAIQALRELVNIEPIERHSGADFSCHYCDEWDWQRDGVRHKDDCPWVRARAALAAVDARGEQ